MSKTISEPRNPGLQAAGRAYAKIRLACSEVASDLMHKHNDWELRRKLTHALDSAACIMDGYADQARNEALESILKDLEGGADIENLVEGMTLEDVILYAREHGIDFDPLDQWLDDMWPDKDNELRDKVMEHMMTEKGE